MACALKKYFFAKYKYQSMEFQMSNNSSQINKEKLFEIELVKKMEKNPTDEVAEELLSLYVKHKVIGNEITEELRNYINSFFTDLESESVVNKLSAIVNKIGRPSYEHKHIAMNTVTWGFILSGVSVTKAYEETASIFNTDCVVPRQAFERKSHDFGKKELCRIGLDVFILMNNHRITSSDEQIVDDILEEPILTRILKDEEHRNSKYKDLLNKIVV